MTRSFPLPRGARVFGLLLLVLAICLLAAPTGFAQDVEPEGLVPGQTVTYRQTVPVNVCLLYTSPSPRD